MANESTKKVAAAKSRQMEVFQLTLNTDGTVDSALRVPADANDPLAGGGMGDRLRYNSVLEAPTLGQRLDVTYTPAV